MQRRTFIKTGLIGGLALAGIAKLAYGPLDNPVAAPQDDQPFAFLTPEDRTALAVIAASVLAGALPEEAGARATAIRDTIRGVDTAVAGFLPTVQAEVRELMGLVTFPVTRRLVAGVSSPWASASPEEVNGFLKKWQGSSVSLLVSAHQAILQLIQAAWYGNPASWQRIGYAGPPSLA